MSAKPLSVELENRRLAVAQAFRDARTPRNPPRTESLPRQSKPHDELSRRLTDVEHAVTEVRSQIADVMSRLAPPVDPHRSAPADDTSADDDGEPAPIRPSVPPLELAGLMSPVASRALFGHS